MDVSKNRKPDHPLLGTRLGQYLLTDIIGIGAMGVVFKARQESMGRDVALKLLPQELADDEIIAKRLEREAKTLAKLNHPNIVMTFDFGMTSFQQAYLVMEFIEGRSLQSLVRPGVVFDAKRALRIFIQIADAMDFAHQRQIIHRDIKPHNIMLTNSPSPDHVKVLDFGIAKLAQETQRITQAGEVVGSPLYMSPEQCLGKSLDKRSDLYSLACVMFECLTGQVPFKGANFLETSSLKCTSECPTFYKVAPGVTFPAGLEDVVRSCLELDPDDRPSSMGVLKRQLQAVLAAIPQGQLTAGGGHEPGDATPLTGRPEATVQTPSAFISMGNTTVQRPAPKPPDQKKPSDSKPRRKLRTHLPPIPGPAADNGPPIVTRASRRSSSIPLVWLIAGVSGLIISLIVGLAIGINASKEETVKQTTTPGAQKTARTTSDTKRTTPLPQPKRGRQQETAYPQKPKRKRLLQPQQYDHPYEYGLEETIEKKDPPPEDEKKNEKDKKQKKKSGYKYWWYKWYQY